MNVITISNLQTIREHVTAHASLASDCMLILSYEYEKGKGCIGYYFTDPIAVVHLGMAAIVVLGEEDASKLAGRCKIDDHGKGRVIYFPGVSCEPKQNSYPNR